jgi:hypothetical protein
MLFLRGMRILSDSTSLLNYLREYVIKFDYERVKFSIKKYYHDRKYYYSLKSSVLGS